MLSLRARLEGKNIDSQGLATKIQQLERQLQNAGDRQKRSEDMTRDVRERTEVKMVALKEDYLVRKVERTQWEKVREQLQTEMEQLEAEERAWIAKNEGELNEMLAEYWTMRKQAGEFCFFSRREQG
jgi:kinetochore protein Nuf2